MEFSNDNDFTMNREIHWSSNWPFVVKAPSNKSGYHDIFPRDYLPQSLLDFRFERLLTYPDDSTVYRKFLHASPVAVALYLSLIVAGQHFMKKREPFNLKFSIACWNLGLTVYSLIGSLRLLPHLIYGHAVNPAAYFLCRNAQGHSGESPVYFWISLFIWSKYIELFDTAFLVLRKRPVSFLHWFHHATVLLYTWHSMAHQTNTGIYFAGMNYLVHTVMYFYYFLAAIGKRPNWGLFVTVLQIAQMFVGIGINAFQFYASTLYPHCDVAWRNLHAAIAMYTAYLALFLRFFINRYCHNRGNFARASLRNGNGIVHDEHAAEQIKNKTD